MYHIPRKDLPSVLEKIHNALEPKGVLYANFKKGKGEELQENPASYPGHPRAYWFYSRSELEKIFAKANFEYKIRDEIFKLFGESYFHIWANR